MIFSACVLLYPDAFHHLVPLAIAVLLFAFVKQCWHPVSIYVHLAIAVHVHVSFSLVQWHFGVYCVVVVVQQMSHHGVVQYNRHQI